MFHAILRKRRITNAILCIFLAHAVVLHPHHAELQSIRVLGSLNGMREG